MFPTRENPLLLREQIVTWPVRMRAEPINSVNPRGGSLITTSSFFFVRSISGLTAGDRRIKMIRDHKVETILTFVLGAGVGAVIALLLAPKAGEELRDDIADGVSDGVNRVRSTGKDLKRRTQKIVALAQDHVQDAVEAGQEAYSQAKKA